MRQDRKAYIKRLSHVAPKEPNPIGGLYGFAMTQEEIDQLLGRAQETQPPKTIRQGDGQNA